MAALLTVEVCCQIEFLTIEYVALAREDRAIFPGFLFGTQFHLGKEPILYPLIFGSGVA